MFSKGDLRLRAGTSRSKEEETTKLAGVMAAMVHNIKTGKQTQAPHLAIESEEFRHTGIIPSGSDVLLVSCCLFIVFVHQLLSKKGGERHLLVRKVALSGTEGRHL